MSLHSFHGTARAPGFAYVDRMPTFVPWRDNTSLPPIIRLGDAITFTHEDASKFIGFAQKRTDDGP